MFRSARLAPAVALAAVLAASVTPATAQAATCADYATQADAQRAADTRDADGDGLYCESLPCPCSQPRRSGSGGQATTPAPAPRPKPITCGKERQAVKTLQDPGAARVSFDPVPSTVEALRALPTPGPGSRAARLPGEFTTYRLRVRLRSFKFEQDADIHLVVSSPDDATKTMIVEPPNGACTGRAGPRNRRRMTAARSSVLRACGQPGTQRFTLLRGTATPAGVAFFDTRHGQRGVAPNGIELHPVLSFRSTSRCAAR